MTTSSARAAKPHRRQPAERSHAHATHHVRRSAPAPTGRSRHADAALIVAVDPSHSPLPANMSELVPPSLGDTPRLGYACRAGAQGHGVADRALVSPTFREYVKLANPMRLGYLLEAHQEQKGDLVQRARYDI